VIENLVSVPGLAGLDRLQESFGVRLTAIGDLPRRVLLADIFPNSFPDLDLFSLLPLANRITLLVEGGVGREVELREAIYRCVPLAGTVAWRLLPVRDTGAYLSAVRDRASIPVAALSLSGSGDAGIIDPLGARGEYERREFSYRDQRVDASELSGAATVFEPLKVLDYLFTLFEVQPLLRLSVAEVSAQSGVAVANKALKAYAIERAREFEDARLGAHMVRRLNITVATASSQALVGEVFRLIGLIDFMEKFPVAIQTRLFQILRARQAGHVLIDSTWMGANQFRLPLSTASWETESSAQASLSSALGGKVALESDEALIVIAPMTVLEGEIPTESPFDGEFVHITMPLDSKTISALRGYRETDLALVLAFRSWSGTEIVDVPSLVFPVPAVFSYRSDEQGYVAMRINTLQLPAAMGQVFREAGITGQPVLSAVIIGATGGGRGELRDARNLALIPAAGGALV
jgi:hypothetical protein